MVRRDPRVTLLDKDKLSYVEILEKVIGDIGNK